MGRAVIVIVIVCVCVFVGGGSSVQHGERANEERGGISACAPCVLCHERWVGPTDPRGCAR